MERQLTTEKINHMRIKSVIVDYIAEGIRYSFNETGLKEFPESAILLVSDSWYYERYLHDSILDIPIYYMHGKDSTNYSFNLLLPYDRSEKEVTFVKAFQEFQESNSLENRLESL